MRETLEEVLGSSMCQFSVIENKLAILYRNQVKIYDATTKEQDKNKYSEKEVIQILINYQHYLTTNDDRTADEWFENLKRNNNERNNTSSRQKIPLL
jgi:hypothetical protein